MRRIINTILAALLMAAILPATAHAMPKAWRGSHRVTQAGVTYRVTTIHGERVAVVTRIHRKDATIPAEIKRGGRWYEVRAIWDGAIPRKCRRVTIHADLECCEDGRLWSVGVRVTRKGMYRWLHRTGAHVTLIRCDECE